MNKLQFTTAIRAPRQKIWQILWDDATYRQWTSVFSEDSHAITDWQTGSRIKFTDGTGAGMFSEVAEARPPELMAIRHLGEIKNGEEQPQSDWAGAMEVYRLEGDGEMTQLTVELDANEQWQEYFQSTFPKALEKVKALAEG